MAPPTAQFLKTLAAQAGFELAGITPALPHPDYVRYQTWIARGYAAKMGYLTDHRAQVRADPRSLLPTAKSILCLGKLYNTDHQQNEAKISRYAWGKDYHQVLRPALQFVVDELQSQGHQFEYKLCIDTAPLLERSYARAAGLGWIGKNTCLINQQQGSWFFLAEILLSLDVEPDSPPPDRCGTCTRCIDACPTAAIVTTGDGFGGYTIDSRNCISYLTIELKGPIPESLRDATGAHLFGCDICQDVCPWNRRAPFTDDPAFAPATAETDLVRFAYLSADEKRLTLRESPLNRAKHSDFLRNVALVMGNLGREDFRKPLEYLSQSNDATVKEQAIWSLEKLHPSSDD